MNARCVFTEVWSSMTMLEIQKSCQCWLFLTWMPPAVFLPCILHYLPFIQLMNTSGSACPVLWLLWGSSKTKLNEETLNEHLILGCKHNMIRPPGIQLCPKPLLAACRQQRGSPLCSPLCTAPVSSSLQPAEHGCHTGTVTQGLSQAGTTGDLCQQRTIQSWACLDMHRKTSNCC